MEDDLTLAEDIVGSAPDASSPFRICKVTGHSGTASVTIDYGGTPVPIPKARMYCGSFPADNQWVVVGIIGTDRFILGARLP